MSNEVEEEVKTKKEYNLEPTSMQLKAIEIWVESGRTISKGEALRRAKYSEASAKQPSRVFNSPAVMGLLELSNIDPIRTLNQLDRKTRARHLDHMVFPPFNSGKHERKQNGEDVENEENKGEKRGEQLTDADIIEMLEETGCKVRKIVHGDLSRHVYFWTDDNKSQLDAIDKVMLLYGLYAPRRSEVKATVGHFSLSQLRKQHEEQKAKENITETIIDNETKNE